MKYIKQQNLKNFNDDNNYSTFQFNSDCNCKYMFTTEDINKLNNVKKINLSTKKNKHWIFPVNYVLKYRTKKTIMTRDLVKMICKSYIKIINQKSYN